MQTEIASPADLDRVVNVVNDAYRGSSKAPGWTDERALLAGQRTDLEALKILMERNTVLVARDGNEVVGCVAVRPIDNDQWYLSMLAVDPECQAGGVGKTIMRDAETFARSRGARRMKISVVNKRDTLIAWYERQGYTRTGVVEPFPYEDPSVGHALRDDLALVMLTKAL